MELLTFELNFLKSKINIKTVTEFMSTFSFPKIKVISFFCLPRKVQRKYQYASRFVQLTARSKSPKITYLYKIC